jgi:hypothetical protein
MMVMLGTHAHRRGRTIIAVDVAVAESYSATCVAETTYLPDQPCLQPSTGHATCDPSWHQPGTVPPLT